ncbi:MAG: nucleotide sugar epimerase [Bacteroidetes bacterium]|nr:nucleotide sugar epimerase [Bacteroidota bacterium]
MAKVLLTGAAGFIGYNAYMRLSADHEVVALDSFSAFSNYQIKQDRVEDITGSRLAWDSNGKLISRDHSFYHIDIADMDQVKRLFSQYEFDIVVHLAAMTGVRQSITEPQEYERSNVLGFLNIMECCGMHDVKKVIYASSSSVYGGSVHIPFREDEQIDKLLNYYAITKRENEIAAEKYSSSYQMQIVGLRFFTVYGPWTRPDMATYTFMDNIMSDKAIKLFNHGNMERDFTYVGDIVESISKIISKLEQKDATEPSHAIYNIGEGKPIHLRKYVEVLESKLHAKAIIENAPMNEGEMLVTFADCSKLFEFIGFRPTTTIEEGLDKTVEWFLKYRDQKLRSPKTNNA